MKALLVIAVVIVCLALILGPAVIDAGEAAAAKAQSNVTAACASNSAVCDMFNTTPAISAEGGR